MNRIGARKKTASGTLETTSAPYPNVTRFDAPAQHTSNAHLRAAQANVFPAGLDEGRGPA
jgi:hypothetical protein